MCGRYNITRTDALQARFDLDGLLPALAPVYNVAPSMRMPVVVRHSPNSLELARWGFVPAWAKEKPGTRDLINARDDRLRASTTFAPAFASSRCIVPATGFYEWRKVGSTKVPYHIRRTDQDLFGFAGLLLSPRDPQGGAHPAYVIITTSPNATRAPIHHRMPAILTAENEDSWLDPDHGDVESLLALLRPYPDELLEAYPVTPAINSPRNNDADLIKPEVNSA